MNLYRGARTGDGRIVIIVLFACSFMILNLFPTLNSNENEEQASLRLSYSTENWLHITKTTSDFEPSREGQIIPNGLLPMFFMPIRVNSAKKDLLVTTRGIGSDLADKIISFRKENGPFKREEDLMKLQGVGVRRARYLTTVLLFDEVLWTTE